MVARRRRRVLVPIDLPLTAPAPARDSCVGCDHYDAREGHPTLLTPTCGKWGGMACGTMVGDPKYCGPERRLWTDRIGRMMASI